jgi:hypothetical protein
LYHCFFFLPRVEAGRGGAACDVGDLLDLDPDVALYLDFEEGFRATDADGEEDYFFCFTGLY